MEDTIKERILKELSKPLRGNEVYLAETIGERIGVSKDHTKAEWLVFYKELTYCIDGGLVAFNYDFDAKSFKSNFQVYNNTSFYMNYLASKGIRITTNGELWLAQITGHKTPAPNIHVASGNTVGLINIGSIS